MHYVLLLLLLVLAFLRDSKNIRTVDKMNEGSAIAPVPDSPCDTGGIRLIPNSSIAMICFSVNEFLHIYEFIDGATKIGFS